MFVDADGDKVFQSAPLTFEILINQGAFTLHPHSFLFFHFEADD